MATKKPVVLTAKKLGIGSKSTKESEAEAKAIQARLKATAPKGKKAWKKKETFTSWSFSRFNDYKQCPRKAKLKHLDKISEPPNDAMARGADIGRLAELFIKGGIKKMPAELVKFKEVFEQLKLMYKKTPKRMVIEDSWAMTKTWGPSTWNDWDNCAVRVKIDAGHMDTPTSMVIRDWKTGKYRAEKREEYVEQLELYALSALVLNPQLEKVEAFLCYLDVGLTFPEPKSEDAKRLTFTRADMPMLKKTWDKRTRAMLFDQSFAPRPNDKCRWCHYRKENTANLPGKKQLCEF